MNALKIDVRSTGGDCFRLVATDSWVLHKHTRCLKEFLAYQTTWRSAKKKQPSSHSILIDLYSNLTTMASTVEQNPNSPPSGGMVTLPTHVIWTKDGGGVKERVFNSTSPKHSEELSAKPEPLLPTSDTVGSIDPAQRAFRLERSLRFLKSQHHKMLLHLQMEIEALKTRNKGILWVKGMKYKTGLSDDLCAGFRTSISASGGWTS